MIVAVFNDNVLITMASDIYSKYMVEAYSLNACESSYNKSRLSQYKLERDLLLYGCPCTEINKTPTIMPCNEEIPEEPIIITTDCQACVYVHIQTTAKDTWNVIYGLGYKPNVTIVMINGDGTEVEIKAQVVYTEDMNSLSIRFSEPVAGKAYLS